MCCRCRCMDELKPATSQLVQDAGDVMGHKNQIDKINIRSVPVLSSTVSIVNSARDLGVVIDSRLTMSDQVIALCRAGYYQLCQLRPVARSLPEECANTLVQAFISSRLHYCNALFYGISDSLFRRLQSIHNATAPPASLRSCQRSHCSEKKHSTWRQ